MFSLEVFAIIIIIAIQLIVAFITFKQIHSLKTFLPHGRASLELKEYEIPADIIESVTPDDVVEHISYLSNHQQNNDDSAHGVVVNDAEYSDDVQAPLEVDEYQSDAAPHVDNFNTDTDNKEDLKPKDLEDESQGKDKSEPDSKDESGSDSDLDSESDSVSYTYSAPDEDKLYYLNINGTTTGPFNKDYIKSLIDEEDIDDTVLIWISEESRWQSILSIPELSQLFDN